VPQKLQSEQIPVQRAGGLTSRAGKRYFPDTTKRGRKRTLKIREGESPTVPRRILEGLGTKETDLRKPPGLILSRSLDPRGNGYVGSGRITTAGRDERV